MYCSETKLVEGVHISLVLGVLEEESDVDQVDILGGHVKRSEIEVSVHMLSTGPGLQQRGDVSSSVVVVLVKSKVEDGLVANLLTILFIEIISNILS